MALGSSLVHEPNAVLRDGRWRCEACGSTIYVRINDTVRQKDAPPYYSVEWVCWMGAHTVKEKWFKGSPIATRPLPKPEDQPQYVTVYYRGGRPVSSAPRIIERKALFIRLDTNKRAGCTDHCQITQYVDASRGDGTVYETIFHDPDSHEKYGRLSATGGNGEPALITVGDLVVNIPTMEVTVAGVLLEGVAGPTPTEWKILRLLAENVGRIVTQEEILLRVWGRDFTEESHLLRVNMARLRSKISPGDANRYVKTRPGIGYILGDYDVRNNATE